MEGENSQQNSNQSLCLGNRIKKIFSSSSALIVQSLIPIDGNVQDLFLFITGISSRKIMHFSVTAYS